jgi:hypothetical protein
MRSRAVIGHSGAISDETNEPIAYYDPRELSDVPLQMMDSRDYWTVDSTRTVSSGPSEVDCAPRWMLDLEGFEKLQTCCEEGMENR